MTLTGKQRMALGVVLALIAAALFVFAAVQLIGYLGDLNDLKSN